MPIAQKWYILELWLLLNSNKKPRARSQTMAISSGQKTYIVNISQTNWYRTMVTVKCQQEVKGCLLFAVVISIT